MTPETLEKLEQAGRTAALYSPLLLLLFKSVRAWTSAFVARLVEPITSRIRANADALEAMRATLNAVNQTVQEDLGAIRAQVSVIAGIARLQQDSAHDIGYFESDADGKNVWVSQTYARWLHATPDDLLGWGFLNFTHPDDRQRVMFEWDRCRRQHTDYRERFRMGPVGGPYFEYDIVARPIPEAPPAVAWAGSVRPAATHGHRSHDHNAPRANTGD